MVVSVVGDCGVGVIPGRDAGEVIGVPVDEVSDSASESKVEIPIPYLSAPPFILSLSGKSGCHTLEIIFRGLFTLTLPLKPLRTYEGSTLYQPSDPHRDAFYQGMQVRQLHRQN